MSEETFQKANTYYQNQIPGVSLTLSCYWFTIKAISLPGNEIASAISIFIIDEQI